MGSSQSSSKENTKKQDRLKYKLRGHIRMKQDKHVKFREEKNEESYIAEEPEIEPINTTPTDLLKKISDTEIDNLAKETQSRQELISDDLISLYGEQELLDKKRAQFHRDINIYEEITYPEYAKEKAQKKARYESLVDRTLRRKLVKIRKRIDTVQQIKDSK